MFAISQPEHRQLLGSALCGILPAALLVVVAVLAQAQILRLGGIYAVKALLVLGTGALIVLAYLPAHHPHGRLGPANQVTIVRGALVALLAGLIGEPENAQVVVLAVCLAVVAASLDGLDGWLARRTGMSSAFGARFDMETDALLILVLAALVWQFGKAPAWVLLSGLLRYAFVAASRVLSWMQRPLPASFRRKTIAVVQTVALIVALAPFVPPSLSTGVVAASLGMLAYSFLIDTLWLARRADEPLAIAQTSFQRH